MRLSCQRGLLVEMVTVGMRQREQLTTAEDPVPVEPVLPLAQGSVFDRVLRRLQVQADARGDLDWDLHFVDAAVVRAHQHAAGARRSGGIGGDGTVEGVGEALRHSQGGFPTKLHLRAEGGGKPTVEVLTVGERHEQFAKDALMDKGTVPLRGRGGRVCGYAGQPGIEATPGPTARRRLRRRRVEPVIPACKDQSPQADFDKGAYRKRNKVERAMIRAAKW